jgi:phage tail sheath protein FI
LFDLNSIEVERIDDVSFDPEADRYIGNVINPGSTYGGVNGNSYINWEERPSYLGNDLTEPTTLEVRNPGLIASWPFTGAANGIPVDPAYSSLVDSAVVGNPALATGIYAFQNPEAYDITLLLTPGFSSGSVIATALQLCESRGDCMYIVDPPYGLRPQQVVDWHNGMLLSDLSAAINSSYGALYWSWLEVNDQFNGGTIWIPPSGHAAAVVARTSRVAEMWFAPAGLNRGRLLTALNVEYSPTQGERDLLYGFNNAVNPIVNFPQDGITIWGQRTLQRADTALDRVNVRMLLIFLKKILVRTLRFFLFEPNDRFLRRSVVNTTEPLLGDVMARRGLTAFKVVCDETNNTPERIDRNELWVSIFLKPTRAVEFVVLNLVVLRTEASFSAEEVLAAGGVVTTNTQ